MFRSVQPASKWAKASSQLRPTFSASVATLQLGIDAASLRAASCPHTTWLPGQHIFASSLHPLPNLYFHRLSLVPRSPVVEPDSVSAKDDYTRHQLWGSRDFHSCNSVTRSRLPFVFAFGTLSVAACSAHKHTAAPICGSRRFPRFALRIHVFSLLRL